MILSMTGFGRGSSGRNTQKVTALLKAVNGRFLDIKVRGNELEPEDEKKIRDLITKALIRGTIHLTLESTSENGSKSLAFNHERFEAMEDILLEIQKKYGRHLDMGDLINSGDLFIQNDGVKVKSKDIIKAVEAAIEEAKKMREAEGEKLQEDLKLRLSLLEKSLTEIEKDLPDAFKKREEKYRKRMDELMGNYNADETRLMQEVAIIAEKGDVTEEVVRLKSHFLQFKNLLENAEPVGRKLNFLLQEMGREINTIGSKSSSERIVSHIIAMKDEAEKMREQVQNVL